MTCRAVWEGAVLAESNRCIEVEGNRYFPPDSLKPAYLQPSLTHTTCGWKGEASYYNVVVGNTVNPDAAWYYPEPKEAANNIRNYVAFWKGVQIEELN